MSSTYVFGAELPVFTDTTFDKSLLIFGGKEFQTLTDIDLKGYVEESKIRIQSFAERKI